MLIVDLRLGFPQPVSWLQQAVAEVAPGSQYTEAELNLRMAVEAGDLQLFQRYIGNDIPVYIISQLRKIILANILLF